MKPDSVAVAYLHPGEVDAGFHTSLLDLFIADMHGERRIIDGGAHMAMTSGANITNGRNELVRQFLDSTAAEWLFMVDADMIFQADALDGLLAAADPVERPIVGGLCFGVHSASGTDLMFPTLYWIDSDPFKVSRAIDYPADTVVRVHATGAAFLLMHRSALETMRAAYPDPWPWFAESVIEGVPVGEDVTFCLRAGAQGMPIYVHTGVKTGHRKTRVLDADAYTRYLARVAAPRFMVTGTGRSGTNYVSDVLTAAGINTGHESYWNPYGSRQADLVGDASWLGVADLENYHGLVYLQARHPLRTLESLMNGELGSEPDNLHYQFKQAHTPGWEPADPLLHNMIRFVAHWLDAAYAACDRMWQLERFGRQTVENIAADLGVGLTSEAIDHALAAVPRDTNKHDDALRPTITWADLPEIPESERLRDLAKVLGYKDGRP